MADIRWMWARQIVCRTYNLPRRSGLRNIIEGQVIELAQFKDEYRYVRSTLFAGETKWTADQIIGDVLGYMAGKFGFQWTTLSFPVGQGMAVEGLELHESCDQALARALAKVPGADVKVNRNGQVVLLDVVDYAATEKELKGLPQTVAGQIDRKIDLRHLRPKLIRVWFDKEVELRFDSEEEGDGSSSVQTFPGGGPVPPLIENVLPLPDPVTHIDGVAYGQGTWVTFTQALSSWNQDLSALSKGGREPPALTLANVRKYWFVLESLYTALGNLTHDGDRANWASRVAAIRAHYRQTYRIPYEWMQRIRSLRGYRIAVLDPVNGTRAPAQAWSQYCKEPTPKAYCQAAIKRDPDLQFFWINVNNYPGYDNDLWTKPASPAIVTVADPDVGIVHIGYKTDHFGMVSTIHPSMMRDSVTGAIQAPTRDLRDSLRGVITVDGKVTGATPIGLADDYRVAILLSAMPLSPNTEDRMFPVEVSPESVSEEVRGRVQIAGGLGPEWNIIVPAGLVTAWYAHRQTVPARVTAARLFGFDAPPVPGGVGPPVPGALAGDDAGYEVINYGDTNDLLTGVARAVAVAQWAAFADAREGMRAVHFAPSLDLVGNIDSVRHRLDPDGALLTDVVMGAARRPIDPMALIPNAIRPWIFGIPEFHA